jgi:hypothetical protein
MEVPLWKVPIDCLKTFSSKYWCIKAAELRSPEAYSAIGSYCMKGFFGKDAERADLFERIGAVRGSLVSEYEPRATTRSESVIGKLCPKLDANVPSTSSRRSTTPTAKNLGRS